MNRGLKDRKRNGIGILLLVGLLAFSSCGLLPKEETYLASPKIKQYAGTTYTESSCMYSDIELSAIITAKYTYASMEELSFQVSGISLKAIYVIKGDFVEEGQLLAELSDDDLAESLDELVKEIEEQTAKLKASEEERNRELQRQAIVNESLSAEAADKAIASINKKYDITKQECEDTLYIRGLERSRLEEQIQARSIYAPFSGMISYVRDISANELSLAGRSILTLVDAESTYFRAKTEYWSYFPEGTEVSVSCKNGSYEAVAKNPEYFGIEAPVYKEGESVNVYFSNFDTKTVLDNGTSGDIKLILDTRTNVLTVPTKAVSEINGESVVYYLNAEGFRDYKPVRVGLSGKNPDGKAVTEIISGLSEGDLVIVK